MLDFPLDLLDPLDDDLDRVTEAVGTAPAAADERRSELVQLEVVTRETTGRKEALENLAEAHEQARADHPDDLSVERLLPPTLEQLLVEQPGQTELVREVLDLCGLALTGGGVFGQPGQVPAREAPFTDGASEAVGQLERRGDVVLGVTPFGLGVGEACAASDDRAVELWRAARRQLDRDAQAILVRPQAAPVVGELRRQHRRGEPWDVGGEGPPGGAAVER